MLFWAHKGPNLAGSKKTNLRGMNGDPKLPSVNWLESVCLK